MRKTISRYCKNCVLAFLIISISISPLNAASEQKDQRVLTVAQQRLRAKITYSCRDLPIATVLMQMAEQAQIDIIKSPKVKGNVTVKVTDVPLEEALNNILAAHGFTYIATENMIRVVPLVDIAVAAEKFVTQIYRITFANIDEVTNALRKFISKDGEIAYNKGTSNLMVTDVASKIKAIDNFIEEIDRITPQVLVEVRIYDITNNESFSLDVQWHAIRNTPLTEVTQSKEHVRTDTLTGPTDTYETTITDDFVYKDSGEPDNPLTSVREDLVIDYEESTFGDKIVRKIKPETTGYGATDTDTTKKELKSWLVDEDGEHLDYRRSKPFVGGEFVPGEAGRIKFALINNIVDLEFVLAMLHSKLDAKLLANPRVLVLDNETANFKSVKEIPYKDLSQTSMGGSMTVIKFKDVGIELQVTPHITRNGMVRLHIIPEFNVLQNPLTQATLSTDEVPVVDTRRADTVALIKDGQTIVIGGLRQTSTSKGINKVPILGDMPLLGGLFRAVSETEVTNEVVVFITPTIITEPVLSEDEAKQLNVTNLPALVK